MPEASVDEDNDTLASEDDVGTAAKPRNGREVLSEAKAPPVER